MHKHTSYADMSICTKCELDHLALVEKLQKTTLNTKPLDKPLQHSCSYTIPVEWEEFTNPGATRAVARYYATKLRCECGKEIDR